MPWVELQPGLTLLLMNEHRQTVIAHTVYGDEERALTLDEASVALLIPMLAALRARLQHDGDA